ncbi:MAG: O-antigen ligase family protein [Cyclobacteriaceae bacterium]
MENIKSILLLPFSGLLLAALICVFILFSGLLGIGAMILFPFILLFFYFVFNHPSNALVITLVFAFMSIGMIRYMPSLPLGLTVDFALALTIVSALFQPNIKIDYSKINNGLMLVTLLWMAYNLAQLINPEARSIAAWFYAVRGTAIYMFMAVPLTLLFAHRNKDLNRFIKIILIFSLFAAIWGLKQYIFGVDAAENRWLNEGSRSTHVLLGHLRIFSFFSDAGQFGAGIAHAGVIAMVLAMGPFKVKYRILLALGGLLFFYLMILSGTRGALIVPIAGALTYLFASKNFKIMLAGLLALGMVFVFLKFSNIGNENFQIRRMRSALDPEDASLNVRFENQMKIASYLSGRPFGGGIGTSGSWGKRFSPGTFLAETPNDSWYVKIWAEMGIVGLLLHLGILFYIGLMALFKIWKIKDRELRQKLLALLSGYVGIAIASYGNPLLGQMPTGIILYMSWSYFFLSQNLDEEITTQKAISNHA